MTRYPSASLSSDYSAITIASDKMLTALIYTGSLPRYSEPKAYLLNREQRHSTSTFPTTPDDDAHVEAAWIRSPGVVGNVDVEFRCSRLSR